MSAPEGPPIWSVMVPTYNPSDLLEQTLRSAVASLDAAGSPAELVIVDDASSAVDVQELLVKWGLESIVVHRRPVNGGLGACWNTCIERARGKLVHILHQDDLVKPAFHERMGRLHADFPQAGMLFCRTEFLDGPETRPERVEQVHAGLVDGWLSRIAAGQRLQCPAVVVLKETYRRVGGFDPSLRYVIDWEMWVRIAASVPVAYLPEALATYRIHSSAETRRVKSAGLTTQDFAAGLERIRETLRRAGRLDCLPPATAYAVACSVHAAHEAEARHEHAAAAREVKMSLRHLYGVMTWRQRLRQIRWYLRLLVRGGEGSPALEPRA